MSWVAALWRWVTGKGRHRWCRRGKETRRCLKCCLVQHRMAWLYGPDGSRGAWVGSLSVVDRSADCYEGGDD